MRAFISWSGHTSRAIATIVRHDLGLAFPSVEFWMTAEDIPPGTEWFAALGNALSTARLSIVCLTPQNLASQWILFESGAVSNALGRNAVVPLLYELTPADLTGPLAQFQAVRCDLEGMRYLFRLINTLDETTRRTDSALAELVEIHWPRVEAQLGKIPAPEKPQQPVRPDRAILEEILALLRHDRRQSPIVLPETFHDRAWRAEDFAGLTVQQIEEFFAKVLWPQAKDRAHRNWSNVPARDPFLNAREEAIQIAEASVDRLGLREQWSNWFPRRPVP